MSSKIELHLETACTSRLANHRESPAFRIGEFAFDIRIGNASPEFLSFVEELRRTLWVRVRHLCREDDDGLVAGRIYQVRVEVEYIARARGFDGTCMEAENRP